jgi:predicted transcriptional regulator
MSIILISIRPKHSENIFNGKKRFEFRKRLPKEAPDKALVYVTSPKKEIVGTLVIKCAHHEKPDKLWKQTRRDAGVSKKDFDSYFNGCEKAHALEIKKAVPLPKPVPLTKLNLDRPPQSWQYIDEKQFRKVAKM